MEDIHSYHLPVSKEDKKKLGQNGEVFEEKWPDVRMGFKSISFNINRVLHKSKTKFQDVLVFDSTSYGRILCIEGVIQLTEFDEFAYHEMLAFTPLAAHPNPEKVLIIGGGDGGTAREAIKFPSVKSVTVCEIDEDIVKICETYFPSMTKSFKHPKVNLIIQDAFDFLSENAGRQKYDVIICDSSDPDEIGPQASLMQDKFYKMLREALLPNGILCSQIGTNMWQRETTAEHVIGLCKRFFPVAKCLFLQVPAFWFGQNGCVMCSINKDDVLSVPKWKFSNAELDSMGMKFYNSTIHTGLFALPRFAEKYFNNIGKNDKENINNNDIIIDQIGVD